MGCVQLRLVFCFECFVKKRVICFPVDSGVKAVDKREGGGSHNWGTIKDDMLVNEFLEFLSSRPCEYE